MRVFRSLRPWIFFPHLFLLAGVGLAGPLALFALRGPVSIPRFEQEPNNRAETVLPPLSIGSSSEAWYGTLASGQDVDFFPVAFASQGQRTVHLSIPVNDLSSMRQPRMAILGPGLGTPREPLPFERVSGQGALLFESQKGKEQAFENPFRCEAWMEIGTWTFELPDRETYVLAVYDPLGEMGKYTVLFDGEEPRAPTDLVRVSLGGLRAVFGRF
ncbi:MAG TPA: hypothetical protein VJB99_02215 [Patescibacteria group bacterium]|nr:hypothetical protein [Patescibacteria group bacterium]